MPTEIHRDDVQRFMEHGAQLIEVLHTKEYEREHLPRALHIPLTSLSHETTAALEHDRPVIVYCYDYQ